MGKGSTADRTEQQATRRGGYPKGGTHLSSHVDFVCQVHALLLVSHALALLVGEHTLKKATIESRVATRNEKQKKNGARNFGEVSDIRYSNV